MAQHPIKHSAPRWAVLLVVCLAAQVTADSSVPNVAPPAGPWQERCAARLRQAQAALAVEEPGFAAGSVELERKPRGVHFDARVADREHARFFAGKPAHYVVHVVEKKSAAPGELGANVGTADDDQASVGFSRWTRRRAATLDVQIAEGKRAFRFRRAFEPAVDDCLR